MNIPSAKYLKSKADRRLESGQEPKKVILWYAGITLLSSFVVTGIRYALADQISHTGGLQNIGLRSILSTADNVVPILQSILFMCLELGYIAAMLRIARRQYASPRTLKAGAERFWNLLRTRVLKYLIYTGAVMLSFYAALGIFMFTSLSDKFMEIAEPLIESGVALDPSQLAAHSDAINALMKNMLPMFVVYGLALAVILVPISYRFRLVDYLLIDQPQLRSFFVLRQSRMMMRGNAFALFKIDLSFWWYYLLETATLGLAYLDVILNFFGITIPLPDVAMFFGTYAIYLAAQFTILYFLKNKVAITYALAYDSLVPKETNDNAVAIGNIFAM